MRVRVRKFLFAIGGIVLAAVALSNYSAPPPRPATPTAQAVPGVMGPPAPPPEAAFALAVSPNDLVEMALADLQTVPVFDRPFTRYLAIQDGSKASLRTCSLAMNYISRASAIYRPMPVANGHLARIDLRWYAPREADLKEWLTTWEEFAFDPMFALLITRDTINFAGVRDVPRHKVSRLVEVPGGTEEFFVDEEWGNWFDQFGRKVDKGTPGAAWRTTRTERVKKTRQLPPTVKTVEEEVALADVDVVRFNAGHLDQQKIEALQRETGSLAPVVDHRYFLTRAMATIKDKGVFATVFGGLYYELRGVRKAKDVLGKDTKATDLDLYFESLGIGNIKAGLTQERLFDTLRSDQRLAVFRSDITGKPRDVSSFHTPADKEGGSWGAITGDVKDGDIDIGDRAFANLLTPRRAAREAIFPTANSFPIFALFNGDGARQDEVPPDVAVDSTIPAPHTRRLQPSIGCIRCHGTDGSDGWKPLRNDIKTLLFGRLDIFGDLSQHGRFSSDVVDRLAGLYAGDFSKNLRRARDDLAEATLRATGPWEGDAGQTDTAKVASQRLADEWSAYNYDRVDAQQALREMGYAVPAKQSVEVLKLLVPPDVRQVPVEGFFSEDVRLGALQAGISINRADFALVFGTMAERASRNRATVDKILKAAK